MHELPLIATRLAAVALVVAGCKGDEPRRREVTPSVPIDAPPPSPRQLLLARNRELVRIAAARFPTGSIEVDGNGLPQANSCHRAPARYTLTRRDDGFAVHLDFEVAAPDVDDDERVHEMLRALDECGKQAHARWAEFGIAFDISFRELLPSERPIRSFVTLIDEDGRSNAIAYYMKSPHLCTTLAHEWGHWLGLKDEYGEDGTCRDAPRYDDDPPSIMANSRAGEFQPRHLQAIFERAWPTVVLVPKRAVPKYASFQGRAQRKHVDHRRPWCDVDVYSPNDALTRFRLLRGQRYDDAPSRGEMFTGDGVMLYCDGATTASEVAEVLGNEMFEVLDPGPLFP